MLVRASMQAQLKSAGSSGDLALQGRKLRLLGLHGFRTSGTILSKQMEYARLNRRLDDLVDIAYLDAPNVATGPLPDGFKANVFPGPYYEWWSAEQDPNTQEILIYKGWDETLKYVEEYIAANGPFDGFWAFSQGTILATLLMAMQAQGQLLQGHPPFKCAVMVGGARPGASVAEPVMARSGRMPTPSMHIIGDADYVKPWSHQLMDTFEAPHMITHPKGHMIPALAGEKLEALRTFLMACQQQRAVSMNGIAQESAHQEPLGRILAAV